MVKPDTAVGAVNKGKPYQHPKQPRSPPTLLSLHASGTVSHLSMVEHNAQQRMLNAISARKGDNSRQYVGVVKESTDVHFLGVIKQ